MRNSDVEAVVQKFISEQLAAMARDGDSETPINWDGNYLLAGNAVERTEQVVFVYLDHSVAGAGFGQWYSVPEGDADEYLAYLISRSV